jgi:predicted Fe-Mo cluster-binding NifX family protein
MGIKVYAAVAATVKENLSLFEENQLKELSGKNACRAHKEGCGH